MIRKIIKYLSFSIPFLLLIFYLLSGRSPFGKHNSSFAAPREKEITKIEFTGRTSDLILEKKGEEWIVDKKFETRKSSIQFILKILTEMQIKSPVTPELFKEEIVNKNITPIRVRIFAHRRLIRAFLVYKTPSNSYGNIMKMREGSKPFIVYVPGNETEIGSAFTVNELFWRPYTIFSLRPSEILSVRLENQADTGSSFLIESGKGEFILSDMKKVLTGWDTSRINRYLSYFTHVPFESWAFDISAGEKEKIMKQTPLYKISVEKAGGEKILLTLWERSVIENGLMKTDSDRMWGKIDSINGIFIIRYLDIDPLLKKRSYFFPG